MENNKESEQKLEEDKNKQLSEVMNKYLKRLMVGSLDIIEQYYEKDSQQFAIVRKKILRLGNDQIRDVLEYLGQTHTYVMQFKERKK